MSDTLSDLLHSSAPRENAARMVASVRKAIHGGQLLKGERLLPLRQLAGQYRVALSTAALAVGQLEREGLIVKRAGSGTYVTFEPGSDAGGAVHLWMPLRDHFYQELAELLLGWLQESGIEARTGVWQKDRGPDQSADLTRGWDARRPRALVTQWEFPGVTPIRQQALLGNMRVIATIGEPTALPRGWHSVNPDRTAMCDLAVEHLVAKGHRRIAFVTYSRRVSAGGVAEQNYEQSDKEQNYKQSHVGPRQAEWNYLQVWAMRAALRQHAVSEPLTVCYQAPQAKPEFESLVEAFKGPNHPTALVGDDFRLVMFKRRAEELGLSIFNDLELVGLGDTAWSQATGFSSVSYRPDLIAQQIASLISAKDEELASGARHVLVPPKLIVR